MKSLFFITVLILYVVHSVSAQDACLTTACTGCTCVSGEWNPASCCANFASVWRDTPITSTFVVTIQPLPANETGDSAQAVANNLVNKYIAGSLAFGYNVKGIIDLNDPSNTATSTTGVATTTTTGGSSTTGTTSSTTASTTASTTTGASTTASTTTGSGSTSASASDGQDTSSAISLLNMFATWTVENEETLPEEESKRQTNVAYLNAEGQAQFQITIYVYLVAFDPRLIKVLLKNQLPVTNGGFDITRLLVSSGVQNGGSSAGVYGATGLCTFADGSYCDNNTLIYITINATSILGPAGQTVFSGSLTSFPIGVNVFSSGIWYAQMQITGLSPTTISVVGRKQYSSPTPDQDFSATVDFGNGHSAFAFQNSMVQTVP